MKYYEVIFTITAPAELMQSARDVLSAMAGEAGFESFEDTPTGITGYVQQPLFNHEAIASVVDAFPLPQCTITYQVHEAEYRDWNEQWEQQGFEPIAVGPYIIHDGRHLPDSSLITHHSSLIEIHARQAFGTGTHETTRMMVATLTELPLEGCRVLDCGTGTGILAIAALKGGAREAVGYDIDEWSTENARHNARLNGVEERFTALLGDVKVLETVDGDFDVILANINRNILLADMPAVAEKLAPGGHLILSGFLTTDVPLLLEKAKELGLSLVAEKEDAGWVSIALV